ncbi:sodium/nucleoside cotransporter-like protein [Euroglyphus maynei]|uniref:Sodium/nucleoside cotransporter-like protein n=1 Tax=Euroglyphus maynei TaxID=6958 RepID=A0A1Y3BAQ6_EURMA|nr:sodium/nucleoside cotransporter-like protein [Euroglyphus maynei]
MDKQSTTMNHVIPIDQQQLQQQQNEKLKKRPLYEREISELSIHFSQLLLANRFVRHLFYSTIFIAYNSFLGYAIHKSWNKTENYCDGVKLLTIITVIIYGKLFKNLFIDHYVWPMFAKLFNEINDNFITESFRNILRYLCWISVLIIIAIIIGIRCYHQPERIYSVAGYFGFILIGFIGSKHRNHINWNQILWGFTIQIIFGIFVRLPSLPLMIQSSIFALSGMPVIIFFSFFVSILYYYGLMQIIVNKFGHLLQATIGTTACESISASGNIFLGMVKVFQKNF